MATFSSVKRQHLLDAITDCEARGIDDLCAVYGVEPNPGGPRIRHEGATYDAQAILSVAHKLATGRTPEPSEFAGGKVNLSLLLKNRGFELLSAARTQTTQSTTTVVATGPSGTAGFRRTSTRVSTIVRTTRTRRRGADEVPPAICPSCFTALPGTGVCDNCD